MKVRTFFDANVLVYTDDAGAPKKQSRALDLIEEHRAAGTGVISTQVLQEYYVAATRKLKVAPAIAQRKIELFAGFDVVQIDLGAILAAIDVQRLQQLSFRDALVLESARTSGCKVLLSEDMPSGAMLRDVRIANPFAPSREVNDS
jgi:predicted nucleic acid-binding protein